MEATLTPPPQPKFGVGRDVLTLLLLLFVALPIVWVIEKVTKHGCSPTPENK